MVGFFGDGKMCMWICKVLCGVGFDVGIEVM